MVFFKQYHNDKTIWLKEIMLFIREYYSEITLSQGLETGESRVLRNGENRQLMTFLFVDIICLLLFIVSPFLNNM